MSAERAAMCEKLLAAGVNATLDPGAQSPKVLVDAGRYVSPSGVGAWDVQIPLRCVVAPPGDAAALQQLEELVEACYAVLGFAPAEPGTWAPSPTATAIPAYTLTYPRQIPNPSC